MPKPISHQQLVTVTGGLSLTDLYYAAKRIRGLGQIGNAKSGDDYVNAQRKIDRPGSTVPR